MLIIDNFDTVSLVFSGNFGEFLTGLTLVIDNNSTKTTTTKTFQSVILANSRYTEFGISWANTLNEGEYYFYLKLNGTTILDEGLLRVVGTSVEVPIYKDTMEQYYVYKN